MFKGKFFTLKEKFPSLTENEREMIDQEEAWLENDLS